MSDIKHIEGWISKDAFTDPTNGGTPFCAHYRPFMSETAATLTIFPNGKRQHEVDIDAETTRCPKCGHFYHLDDDDDWSADDPVADFGGTFDGHTVTSDADPGL